MSSQSPASVLYDSTGTALAVYNNTAIVASQPAVLFAGTDGYANVTRTAMMGALGNLGVSQASNNVVVLSNATITNPGSDIYATQFFGVQELALVVNVTAAPTGTGTPTLTFTIQEVDPGDGVTTYGNSASTVGITGVGVFTAVLNITTSSAVKVSWTISGTTPSFTGVYATLTTKATPSTQTITGTITASNPSVGTDGAAFLTSDTQVGGKTTTSAPTYTNGNLDALSLTTLGGLRIDGVYATGTANATAADVMNSGGYVTTAAPTYTTGQLEPLSLDTAGNLRTSVNNTVTVTGTVSATQGTSPWIVAGGGTAGTPASGVITIQGITGMTHLDDDGYAFATSTAPSYTNSTWNPLSVDLAGNLRVTGFVTTNKAASSAVTSVAQATSNTVILSSNATRVFASIYNNSGQKMFIKLGTTASNSSYSIQLMPNSYWEVPNDWTGEIDAVWSGAGGGNALVTELTP